MSKNIYRNLLLVCLFFISLTAYSQEYRSFDVRYQNNLKGDLTIIANNILNQDGGTNSTEPNDPYNNLSTNNFANHETGGGYNYNDYKNMQYIDVDNDGSTFNSSSAVLTFADASCSQIRYVGLYWTATYPSATANGYFDNEGNFHTNTVAVGTDRQTDFDQVKLRVPGGTYVDITADEVLYDGFTSSDNSMRQNSPYACYADVTNLITGLANPEGEYTVANIRAVTGALNPGGGAAGGWSMVIVYENPNLPGRLITTFDGFARVSGSNTVDINYSGFNTIPTGPVNADIGAVTLEGDYRINGDRMQIRAASNYNFSVVRDQSGNIDQNNFFNSDITRYGSVVTDRTPNSTNTLGFDADLFKLLNTNNSVISNNETAATFRFETNGDQYYPFFNSFNIEIIEPEIILEKRVEDIAGNDITGQGVNLGQILDYVLSFDNVGNDDATQFTIRDVLPINTTLDESNFTLPTGVTYTYDNATRTVLFTIPDNLVQDEDGMYSIRMRVQVAENCFDFIDACTDLIQNLAYASYRGVINDNQITDDPSVTDFDNCGFTTPGATNFLLDDLSDCQYNRTVQLCGDDVLLDAGDNFDAYVWYRDENGNNQIDGSDTVITDADSDNDPSTILVNEVGTYMVDKQVADPCKGFTETIVVEFFGSQQSNPISDLITNTNNTVEGEILVCPNDGEELPEIFLCGLNDSEPLQINIPDAESIIWEKLDENSCTAATDDCANKNGTCTWDTEATGANFLASEAGQYRIRINYQNGCFTRFYFNIYKNPLNPQYTSNDIICTTPGNITVTNMPADYEFQLVDEATDNIIVPYSANNGPSFTINTNGAYRVEMRQQGVVDGCIFILDNIGIRIRDFQVDITTKDTDCNGLGEITINALDAEAQYYYEISGTSSDTFGPSNDNNYTFSGLLAGNYTVNVTTDDGCTYTENVVINDVTDLDLEARVSQHITCREGNIQMESTGGQTPHTYAIWSYVDEGGNTVISYPSLDDIPNSAYQTSVIFDIYDPGDYTFVVVDRNNCHSISNTVTIEFRPAVDYTVDVQDESCFGAEDGHIIYNVLSLNGYKVDYTLTRPDGTTVMNSSGTFTGLAQGDYTVTLTQSKGGASCDYIESFTIGGPIDAVTGTAVLTQEYLCGPQYATIQAQNVTGGAAPYAYSIDGVNFNSGAGADTFTNLTDGTYTITIRDANNCTFVTNSIVVDPLNEPTDLSFTSTAPTCPDLTSDVTVTVTDGNVPFTIEIVSPIAIAATSITGNTATFDDLDPDTYTFRVTDDKNCSYEETYTINPVDRISVTGQLIENISCFNGNDGAANFSVSNFSTNYNYSVSGPSTFSGSNETNGTISLTNLADGTYTITVTDNATNCTATDSVTIASPTAALTLSASPTDPTCTSDGSVVLTANGGWGSNTFTLINPDSSTFGTNSTGTFNNLTQVGTYTANVEDANGCIVPTTFTINAAIPPVLAITPNDFCYDDANGLTLTANVTSGGTGTFEYSLNGGIYDTNNVFSGLAPGTYTIDVRDSNNCTDTASITINPELSVTASAGTINACASSTDITITAAGGDGNYVYAVVGNGVTPTAGDFSTTNPASVTAAGDYDVYVRDNNGNTGYCEASYDITITQDNPLALSITNTPVLCSGESSASLTITATGGEAPYTYSINNGATYSTTNLFNNLAAGSYNIRVRDVNNCEVTQTYNITEPYTLSASAAVAELVECNPTDGAEVRITNAQGGTAPYTYSFDGGATYSASSIDYLLPGTHTLYVQDANACTYEMTVTIDPQPTPPNVTAAVTYECDGEGVVTLTPDSTDFDYTYDIDGTPNNPDPTSNIFTDVTPGNHTFTINYITNTPPATSVLLTETFGTGPNTSITEVDPAYCYEPQDGTPSVGASCAGFGTDTHIQDGEYSVTQNIVNGYGAWLSPNNHTGDANGRFLAMNVGGTVGANGIIYAKRNIEVIPNRDITISLWAFNLLTTYGGSDPSINIELVDGVGTVIANQTTGNVPKNNNDPNAWHNYTVTLNPGANTTLDIVIRTNNADTGGNDIAIDDIEAFQTPQACPSSVTLDVYVEDGHAFDAAITNVINATCNSDNNGSITFAVDNFDNVNGFVYSLDGGLTYSAPQTSSPVTINNLTAGTYTILVEDATDSSCAVTLTQDIIEPNAVVASASITEEITCTNGGATITATATGGTPTYEYQLEDNALTVLVGYQGDAFFTGLAAGDYIVRVRDTNGCSDEIDTAITVNAPAPVVFTATPTACYSGNNDGSIVVNVTDGNGGYMFSLNGGAWIAPTPATSTTHTFSNLVPGTYTIDVRDQSGCTAVQQTITISDQLISSAALTNDLTCLVDATITINTTGGSGSYTYEWSSDNGTTYNTTGFTGNVFTTNSDGTYRFRITDTTSPTACTVTTNDVIVTPANTPVISNVIPTNILCNGESTGSLDVQIDTTVGVPPYVINVVETNTSTNYGTQTNGLPAGDYEVTITDDKGCVSNPFSVSITQPDPITYTLDVIDITCTGSGAGAGTAPGSITVQNTAGGTQEYTYIISSNNGFYDSYTTTSGGEDHTFNILDFGIYEVDVVDINGCYAATTEVIASPPDDLDIDVSTTTTDCTTGGTAIVTVSSLVGSGNYEFAILETYSSPYVDDPSTDYQPADTPGGSTATFTGLTPGITYTFVVHDLTTLCYYFETAGSPIHSPSGLTSNIDLISNVTCTGADDGEVNFTFDNYDSGATQVTYEIFNSQSNISTGITGSETVSSPVTPVSVNNVGPLAPGIYYILFSEVGGTYNGCSVASAEFTITESPYLLTVAANSPTNDNCNVNAGVIVATAQNGTAPYEYQFLPNTAPAPTAGSSGWITDNFANVEAGDYIAYVKDVYGCIQNASVTVLEDPSPDTSLSIIDECETEGNFEVLVTLNNAAVSSGPFQISINGGAYQNITFNGSNQYTVSNLSSGLSQTISVRDVNGCIDTNTFNIYPPLQFTANVSTLLDCEPGVAANAEITIEATQGSGNYDYEITGPVNVARTAMPSNPFIWNGASAAGTYAITLYDTSTSTPNCLGTISVEVAPAVTPIFQETHIDVSCNGGTDGSITVTQTDNGINPLTYSISPVAGTWNAATQTYEDLPAGTYTITATGTNSCTTTSAPITIAEPAIVDDVNATVVQFGCTNGNTPNNATITIDNTAITGGSGVYVRYEFINTDTSTTVQSGSNTSYTETNTTGGNYTINVYDENGCVGSTTAQILPYDALLTASTTVTPTSCSPGSDGQVVVNVTSTTNDTTRFEYSINNGTTYQSSNTFTGLGAGTYNFLVRHIDTGCIMATSAIIEEPNTFTIDVVKVQDVVCYGTQTGEVTLELNDSSYTGGFNYTIYNTNGTLATADDTIVTSGSSVTTGPTPVITLEAGSYYVEISQDAFPNCTNTEAFSINGPTAAITGDRTIEPITCVEDGAIEVINVLGGWGGYSYYVSTTANPDPNNSANYTASPRFENLTAGTYEVWVIDQRGCAQQLPDAVLTNPIPITATIQVNQENCVNLQGEIEVLASNGQGSNYTYQLIRNGVAVGAPQTSAVFSGLGAGSYEVQVSDQWGCTATTAAEVLYEEMQLTTSVVKSIDCSTTPGGEITVQVAGASSNLQFTATLPDTSTIVNTTGIFTGLTDAGVYSFDVLDLDTNCSETITEELDAPTPVTFIAPTITDVSCNGQADGAVTVNLTPSSFGVNDNPIYMYELYDALGTTLLQPAQTSATFTGLSANFYQVRVYSSRSCEAWQTFEIEEPAVLTATASATAFACNSNNETTTATITIAASGGTAPYLYSIDNVNYQTSNTFVIVDTGSSQTIITYVRDSQSCPAQDSVTIDPLNVFTATVSQTTAISCLGPEEVLITVSDDGNPANSYTYELLPVGNPYGTQTGTPTITTATYELTEVGTYTFRITDNNTGCYVDTAPYEIAPYNTLEVAATATERVSCFGGNDGEATINITGYTGGYAYTVYTSAGVATSVTGLGNTSTNPLTITGLSGGNYYVNVRQTAYPNCEENSNVFTIVSPTMALTAAVTEEAPTTCDNNSGEILVNPTGGYTAYDIVLTNTTTTDVYTTTDVTSYLFTNLASGNYTVEITDDGGCVITDTITLTAATPITAGIVATPTVLACYGDTNAVVSATAVTGGSGSYQYQLNYYDATGTTIEFSGGFQLNPNFTNLGAGTYSITVSDGWNCDITTTTVTITEPTQVSTVLNQTQAISCTNGAELQLIATGGTAPYEYSADGITYTPMSGTNTHTFTNVAPGDYQYYVRDAFGCTAMISNLVSVEAIAPIVIDIDNSAAFVNCTGEGTAMIIADATGGLGNYMYELYTDAALTNLLSGPQDNGTFAGLFAGSYYVRVTSMDCEEVSQEIIINEPIPLQIDREEFTNVSCSGEENGTITVEVSGGTGEILYAISPNLNQFHTENVFTDLAPGDYTVIAQDVNGCFELFEFTITEPAPLEVTHEALGVVCEGSADGSVTVNITGGTAPYSTAFNANSDADYTQDVFTYSDLAAGTYVVFIRDAQGCETNVIVEIDPGVNINALVTPIYTCSTDMPTTSLEVVLEDATVASEVMYALDSTDPSDMQLDYDFGDIAPGNHYLTISHANGCLNTIDFVVEGFDPLTLMLEQNNINEITAIATGGNPEYTYIFDGVNNGNDNTYYINRTDTYDVTVIDENGCESVQQIYMEYVDVEIPNFFTPNGDNSNDTWIPRNIQQYPEILTIIFDRYGREVYRMGINDTGWNGIYKGKELPSGDYWYVIKLKGENDDREFVGHFTLYR